jgi:hypothetical protein
MFGRLYGTSIHNAETEDEHQGQGSVDTPIQDWR